MPYVLSNSNNDAVIVIPDAGLNQDYDIDLVGRNYENYGAIIAESFLFLLENFATDATPPAKPTAGQIWYDKTNKQIRVYDSVSASWQPLGVLVNSSAPSNDYGQNIAGTLYYNTSTSQLYVHDGSEYQLAGTSGEITSQYSTNANLGNPSEYGTSIKNIFLTDTDGNKRAVMALVYRNNGSQAGGGFLGKSGYYDNEKIVALFSGHPEFTIADADSTTGGVDYNFYPQFVEPGGIGSTIKTGINVRTDDTGKVNFAGYSDRAQAAYSINTGSYGADSATIPAGKIYHSNRDLAPDVTDSFDLGSASYVYAQGYINDLFVGNGTTGQILKHSANTTVNFGSQAAPIDTIYVTDIDLSGNILSGNGTLDLSGSSVSVDTLSANVVNIDGYTLPLSAGTSEQIVSINSAGQMYWKDLPNNIDAINSSDGSIDIVQNTTVVDDFANAITTTTTQVDFTSNVSFIRSQLSGSTYIDYDPASGEISLNYSSDFDTQDISTFVRTFGTETIGGDKTFTGNVVISSLLALGQTDVTYSGSLTFTGDTGTVQFGADGSILASDDITAFSDRRIKENITPIENALDKLSQISGYTYNKVGQHKRSAGVIAQEVLEVLPEVVSEHEDGILSVAYGNMVALLIEAVKELTEEVNMLKAQQKG